ncbi:alpha/beta fold hydrolase [Alkalilimnicola sp. S0819]|uniref:alpha/beta fold hydrolase n=1 Tax=Alkalilimnicola sp. S0819 TaxID=2613922 RepID=UPI001D035771|nr:alpha/beta hydrolase [Alkalilimnicola sp. S0819]
MNNRYYLNRDGYRIAWRQFGEGPRTLLCVHGLYRNGHDFDFLAQGLADRYRVITPDIIGRGDSDYAHDIAHYDSACYLRDLQGLMAELGVEEFDFLGTSMGGMIGMSWAGQADTPIRRLVLNDVGTEIPLSVIREIAERSINAPRYFDSREKAEAALMRGFAEWGPMPDECLRHLLHHSLREDAQGWRLNYDPDLIHGYRYPPGDVDLWPLYRSFHGPVLVFHGELSQVLLAETAERMDREPNTRVITVADTGHAPHLMDAAQIGAVREFLLAP